jgi:hypothetical protein
MAILKRKQNIERHTGQAVQCLELNSMGDWVVFEYDMMEEIAMGRSGLPEDLETRTLVHCAKTGIPVIIDMFKPSLSWRDGRRVGGKDPMCK